MPVYDGDLAEHDWVTRCTPERHPYMYAGWRRSLEHVALSTPEEKFNSMASLHGETIVFVVEDLLARPAERPARDDLWDAELRRQAGVHNLPVLAVDGSRRAAELADELARRFRLSA